MSISSNTNPDYTQGFGSFDFFPHGDGLGTLPKRVTKFDGPHPSFIPSNTVVAPCPQVFPFMRLPLEIRRKIYRILLARLFPGRHLHLHGGTVGSGVRFVVDDTAYSPDEMEVDYDLRVVGRPDDRTVNDRDTSDATYEYIDVLETYKKSVVYERLHTGHPEGADDELDPFFQPPLGWVATERYTTGDWRHWGGSAGPSPRPWERMQVTEDEADDTSCADEDMADCSGSEGASEAGDDRDWRAIARDAVSVTIDREMLPGPRCQHHGPDTNYFSFESPAGPDSASQTTSGDQDINECTCNYRTRDDYRAVFRLSQVSKQFTAEMGSVLWENSTLEIREPAAFAILVRTRFQAVRLVRNVVLHVVCFGDFGDTDVGLVKSACDFFFPRDTLPEDETRARLRSFTVVLSVMTRAVPKGFRLPDDGKRRYNFTETARQRLEEMGDVFRPLEMMPGASFHVRLGRTLRTPLPDRSEPGSYDLDQVDLGKFVSAKIRRMLLPDCVRQKEEREQAWGAEEC